MQPKLLLFIIHFLSNSKLSSPTKIVTATVHSKVKGDRVGYYRDGGQNKKYVFLKFNISRFGFMFISIVIDTDLITANFKPN